MEKHRLAGLFSSLRRTTPRVPFFRLVAHRVPTLWTLYRGLLRNAPGDASKWRLRGLFRRHQHLTSPTLTKTKLDQAHSLLNTFTNAKNGDEASIKRVHKFERNSSASREREAWNLIYTKELAFIRRMRIRPYLTGGHLRPSYYNRPLPRMRNQPTDITMMINKRIKARARRQATVSYLKGVKEDLRLEGWFEARLRDEVGLGNSWEPIFSEIKGWLQPIQHHEKQINASFMLDTERASSKFSEELLGRIKAARRNRISNKTRERERERRGEVVMATLRRMRQGPPAHVLATMSEKEKRRDKIMREVGAGGYSKYVKTGAWGVADEGKDGEMLDTLERKLREYNLQKRAQAKY